MPGLVGVLVVLGMAVVATLGLGRITTQGVQRLRPVWPALGLLAGFALLLHVALPDRAARVLLQVACWSTPVTMLLAVHVALGRATGLPHLSIPQTAATHGALNAVRRRALRPARLAPRGGRPALRREAGMLWR